MGICKGISLLCGIVHDRIRYNVRVGNMSICPGSSCELMKFLYNKNGNLATCTKRLKAICFKVSTHEEKLMLVI